ncbi:MAG TPA: KpsF/GutQ family sugar-phosphate isomerase [Longimicrobiales bacterium]|nr:KpsF/GutQ family sugar-phosphate isomerase [Longimicrobiales bacterium]
MTRTVTEPRERAGNAPADAALLIEHARAVIRKEAAAVAALEERVGDAFVAAVDRIAGSAGRVIVSGIGKSGIVGRKIAATLTSTGTPANFLHPVEGMHGDLGIVGRDDVAILISKSGESEEMGGLIEFLTRTGVAIVALTAGRDSMLARAAEVVLDCSVAEEACPHDLAPTTSTTATLAMGDALAVALLSRRGFTREDFARLHPGGALGRKLTLRVRDVMVQADLPILPETASMREAVVQLAERRGTVAIVDEDYRLSGVLTAGDLTRLMEREGDFLSVPVADVMTRTPKSAEPEALASAVVYTMETHGIMAMPVTDEERRVVGMVHLHDLMRAGAV